MVARIGVLVHADAKLARDLLKTCLDLSRMFGMKERELSPRLFRFERDMKGELGSKGSAGFSPAFFETTAVTGLSPSFE